MISKNATEDNYEEINVKTIGGKYVNMDNSQINKATYVDTFLALENLENNHTKIQNL